MTISEKKTQIVIDNYFKSECDVNTSIRQAFEKGFRIGIKKLPSAQPERLKGHWIFVHPLQEDDSGAYMCSECRTGNWGIDPKRYFFCPYCGADMRGDEDETD